MKRRARRGRGRSCHRRRGQPMRPVAAMVAVARPNSTAAGRVPRCRRLRSRRPRLRAKLQSRAPGRAAGASASTESAPGRERTARTPRRTTRSAAHDADQPRKGEERPAPPRSAMRASGFRPPMPSGQPLRGDGCPSSADPTPGDSPAHDVPGTGHRRSPHRKRRRTRRQTGRATRLASESARVVNIGARAAGSPITCPPGA